MGPLSDKFRGTFFLMKKPFSFASKSYGDVLVNQAPIIRLRLN